jgi:chaperonin GroES
MVADHPVIHPGIAAVRDHLRVLPGHAVVEMHPEKFEQHGVHLLDKGTNSRRDMHDRKLRPATLLSRLTQGREIIEPGATVLMVAADGKRVDSFTLGGWTSAREVRFLGIVCQLLGKPLEMPLTETIMGRYNPGEGRYRPTLSNILLRLPDRIDKSAGGIYLPDALKARPADIAIAESVGPNVKHVKAGDSVIFERRALFEIGLDGHDDLALICEDGIYSVLEDEPDKVPTGV